MTTFVKRNFQAISLLQKTINIAETIATHCLNQCTDKQGHWLVQQNWQNNSIMQR